MTVVISGVWLRRLQLPGERDDIVVRGDAGEPEPRVERDRAGVAHVSGQVQPGDAACLQRRDERVDETAAEALPLQLRQQVDVQVRGIGVAERLRTGAAAVRVAERAVLTGAALIEG